MSIERLGLIELRDKIASGELSASEVVKAVLRRIDEQKDLNAIISVDGEGAIKRAKEIDDKKLGGALCGVPIVVKDNISTKNLRTTCASKSLINYAPPFDATVVEKLKNEGAIIIAKANMDEFAMGSSGENSAFGATKNPIDKTRVAGGSSSGSASAVASFMVSGALGSDTGGSVRLPSAYCGVVGLKPTYSVVSRYGLIAFASSFDQIGPITRSVKDNALLLNAIAGYDHRDSTSCKISVDYTHYSLGVKGKILGVPDEVFDLDYDSEVKEKIENAIKTYQSLGAKIKRIDLKHMDSALASYYTITSAEAASNLARFDGVAYGEREEGIDFIRSCYATRTKGFGDEVKRRIMMGNFVLSGGYYEQYYIKASKIRTIIKNELDSALSGVDAIITPTAPTVAPALYKQRKNSTEIYYEDIFTVIANVSGNPAISIPCGVDKQGLPIGLQLMGKAYGEQTLYGIAQTIEEEVR